MQFRSLTSGLGKPKAHGQSDLKSRGQILVCKATDKMRIDFHLQTIAIDVEYAHIQLLDGSMRSLAAQVCCVSPYSSAPLLKSYCRHPILDAAHDHPDGPSSVMRYCGGVRLSELHGAPSLGEVASEG